MNDTIDKKKEAVFTDIVERLFSSVAAVHTGAFQEICSYWSDDDILRIEAALQRRADTRALHWLLRYLSEIETPLALEKLLGFAQCDDEVLRAEACSRIAKVSEKARENLLLELLNVPYEREVCFAVRELGALRLLRAVEPLIAVWRGRLETKIHIEILRAFRRIRDPRCLPEIERWFPESQGGIAQNEALETLACYATALRPKFMKRCISSPQRAVRQMVYKIIARFSGRRWSLTIAHCLKKETEEDLRVLLLTSCRALESWELFKVILNLAAREHSFRVCMTAESALQRMKSDQLLKWLFSEAHGAAGASKMLIFRLIAGYKTHAWAFDFFSKMACGRQISRRIIGLEFLRHHESANAQRFFLKMIGSNPHEASLAASAMMERLSPALWPALAFYLQAERPQFAGVIQRILYALQHLPAGVSIPENLEAQCAVLTDASEKEVRYLALRCLARFPSERHFLIVLEKSRNDPNASVRQAALRSAEDMIQANPGLLSRLMDLTVAQNPYFIVSVGLLTKMNFSQMNFSQDVFNSFLAHFLNLMVAHEAHPKPGRPFARMRMFYVLKLIAQRHKVFFWRACTQQSWGDERQLLLMRLLNRVEFYDMEKLDPSFILQLYPEASENTRVECLVFLKRQFPSDPRLRQLVFDAIAQTNDSLLVQTAVITMNAWLVSDLNEHRTDSEMRGVSL